MKTSTFLTGCALMLAQPVLAQPVSLIMIPRDSDGIVISVLHPVDYFQPGVTTNGGVFYTLGGVEVQFSHGAGGIADTPRGGPITFDMVQRDQTATVGATTYKVEMAGAAVYLRDPVTGALFPTQVAAMADPNGLKVNPNAFAME